jgi:hypothetical protein
MMLFPPVTLGAADSTPGYKNEEQCPLGTEAGWSATRALVPNRTLYHPSTTLFHLPEPKEIPKPKILSFRNSGQTVKKDNTEKQTLREETYLSWRLAVA